MGSYLQKIDNGMYDNEHEFENGIERSILKDMIAYQKSYRPNFDD